MKYSATMPDPKDGYPCHNCGQMRYPGVTHSCPTALPIQITGINPAFEQDNPCWDKTVHYQQKGVLLGEKFVPEWKYRKAIEALQEIVKYYGKVCSVFELCRHVSCHSSCDSWLTAASTLEDLGEEKSESVPARTHVCHWHYVEIPRKHLVTGKSRLGVCCICEGDECDNCGHSDEDLYGKGTGTN